MKKRLCLLLCLLLAVALCSSPLLFPSPSEAAGKEFSIDGLSFEIAKSSGSADAGDSSLALRAADGLPSSLSMRVGCLDGGTLSAACVWTFDGFTYAFDMSGSAEYFKAGPDRGYQCLLNGFVTGDAENASLRSVSTEEMIVSATLTCTDDGNEFATLVVGYAGVSSPLLLKYGDYTSATRHINKAFLAAHPEVQAETASPLLSLSPGEDPQSYSAVYTDILSGTHNVGSLTMIFPTRRPAFSSFLVRAKVNTNISGAADYFGELLDANEILLDVYPICVLVWMGSLHDSVRSLTNAYMPQDAVGYKNISLYAYLPPAGLLDYTFSYASSSIHASRRVFPGMHPNSSVAWQINNDSGWGDSLDGGCLSEAGMLFSICMQYDRGELPDSAPELQSIAGIRYCCVCITRDSADYCFYYFTTKTVRLLAEVEIT